MCGIIGYSGPLEAKNILLEGLSQLEYRGYDSAGIAYFDTASTVHVVKKTGKVARLKEVSMPHHSTAASATPDGPPTAGWMT